MLGINSSGLFNNRLREVSKKQNDAPNNEIESLKKLILEMKEHLTNQENSFSQQKKELVDLITETIKANESEIENRIKEITKISQLKEESSKSELQSQDKSDIKETVKEQIKKDKPKKQKYVTVCSSIWDNLKLTYPEISSLDQKTFFVGENNEFFHKTGNKYNKLDINYLCQLANKK